MQHTQLNVYGNQKCFKILQVEISFNLVNNPKFGMVLGMDSNPELPPTNTEITYI